MPIHHSNNFEFEFKESASYAVRIEVDHINHSKTIEEGIHAFRLYEVVNHYTDTPFPATYFSIVMNKRKWNRLSEDVQNAILGVSQLQGAKFWGRNWFDTAKDAVMEKTASLGKQLEYHSMSNEERQRWIEKAGRPIWDSWVADMTEKGYPQAQEILDSVLAWCNE